MKKRLLLLLACLCLLAPIRAERFTNLAQQCYEWLKTGRADSVLTYASPEVKKAITTNQLNEIWPQLTQLLGDLHEQEPWETQKVAEFEVYRSALYFSRGNIRLNILFNTKGEISGINYTPLPSVTTKPHKPQCLSEDITERDICISHGKVSLPGTLTMPKQVNEHIPIVILVQGSGPSDRNETIGPNKPFEQIAHALAARGIGVIRYDKRTFVYAQNISEICDNRINYDTEVVDDALQAIQLATQLKEADPQRIYVLGHSLGGTLAPRIAQKSPIKLAGIIGMAAMARPFWETLISQIRYIATQNGATANQADEKAEQTKQAMQKNLPAEYLQMIDKYNPLATAKKLKKLPMLFVQGGHDYQVTYEDLNLWKKALKKNKRAIFKTFPELDHLMRPLNQMAVPADYMQEGHLSHKVTDCIADFILNKH